MNKICLCSSSESRALLLNNFGIDFVQKSVDYDEEKIIPAGHNDLSGPVCAEGAESGIQLALG